MACSHQPGLEVIAPVSGQLPKNHIFVFVSTCASGTDMKGIRAQGFLSRACSPQMSCLVAGLVISTGAYLQQQTSRFCRPRRGRRSRKTWMTPTLSNPPGKWWGVHNNSREQNCTVLCASKNPDILCKHRPLFYGFKISLFDSFIKLIMQAQSCVFSSRRPL